MRLINTYKSVVNFNFDGYTLFINFKSKHGIEVTDIKNLLHSAIKYDNIKRELQLYFDDEDAKPKPTPPTFKLDIGLKPVIPGVPAPRSSYPCSPNRSKPSPWSSSDIPPDPKLSPRSSIPSDSKCSPRSPRSSSSAPSDSKHSPRTSSVPSDPKHSPRSAAPDDHSASNRSPRSAAPDDHSASNRYRSPRPLRGEHHSDKRARSPCPIHHTPKPQSSKSLVRSSSHDPSPRKITPTNYKSNSDNSNPNNSPSSSASTISNNSDTSTVTTLCSQSVNPAPAVVPLPNQSLITENNSVVKPNVIDEIKDESKTKVKDEAKAEAEVETETKVNDETKAEAETETKVKDETNDETKDETKDEDEALAKAEAKISYEPETGPKLCIDTNVVPVSLSKQNSPVSESSPFSHYVNLPVKRKTKVVTFSDVVSYSDDGIDIDTKNNNNSTSGNDNDDRNDDSDDDNDDNTNVAKSMDNPPKETAPCNNLSYNPLPKLVISNFKDNTDDINEGVVYIHAISEHINVPSPRHSDIQLTNQSTNQPANIITNTPNVVAPSHHHRRTSSFTVDKSPVVNYIPDRSPSPNTPRSPKGVHDDDHDLVDPVDDNKQNNTQYELNNDCELISSRPVYSPAFKNRQSPPPSSSSPLHKSTSYSSILHHASNSLDSNTLHKSNSAKFVFNSNLEPCNLNVKAYSKQLSDSIDVDHVFDSDSDSYSNSDSDINDISDNDNDSDSDSDSDSDPDVDNDNDINDDDFDDLSDEVIIHDDDV